MERLDQQPKNGDPKSGLMRFLKKLIYWVMALWALGVMARLLKSLLGG